MDTPLFQVQFPYDFSKLRLLPLRELSAYRMVQNADTCNLTELLVAIVGGQNQIKIADEDPLKRFGGLCGDPASFRPDRLKNQANESPYYYISSKLHSICLWQPRCMPNSL